ncbi:MAG: transposase [Holosporaceae bacterium]|nr:transposase [Holosporaceae bacterium]
MPLIVLPPRRPDYNGIVERGNRTFREEFYNQHNLLANNITEMRKELQKTL